MNRFLKQAGNLEEAVREQEYFGLNASGKPTPLDPDSELAKVYQQEIAAGKQLGGVLKEYRPLAKKYEDREKAMGTVGMFGGALAGLGAIPLAAKNRQLGRLIEKGQGVPEIGATLAGSVGGAYVGNKLQSAHNDKGRKEFAETKLNPALEGYTTARSTSKENFMREGYMGAMALPKQAEANEVTNRFLSKQAKKQDTSNSPFDINVPELLGTEGKNELVDQTENAAKKSGNKAKKIGAGVGAAGAVGAAAYGAKKWNEDRQDKQAFTDMRQEMEKIAATYRG